MSHIISAVYSIPIIEHPFTESGEALVQLQVTDNEGDTDLMDSPIHLTILNQDFYTPYAQAYADQVSDYVFSMVNFYGADSFIPSEDEIVKWEWDWDNDGIYDEEGSEATQYWTDPGTYLVQFRVTDSEGNTDELDEPIEVTINDAVPNPVNITPSWLNADIKNIIVEGNYAYISAGYSDFFIVDITDINHPHWVAHTDKPSGGGHNMCFSDGYIYITDHLWVTVIDVDPPESVHVVTSVGTPGICNDVVVRGDYVFATCYGYGLVSIDISSPESPVLSWQDQQWGGSGRDIDIVDNYAMVAFNNYLFLYDISTPDEISRLEIFPIFLSDREKISDIILSPDLDRVYILTGHEGSSPIYPRIIMKALNIPELTISGLNNIAFPAFTAPGMALHPSGDYVYIANDYKGFHTVYTASPESIHIADTYLPGGYARAIFINGNMGFFLTEDKDVHIMDLQNI